MCRFPFLPSFVESECCFLYIPITMAVFDQSIGSLSGNNKLEAYYEDLLVSGSSFRYIKCARFWLRYSLKRLFRFIIPESIMIKRRRLRIERNQDTKCVYWKKS